MIYKNISRDVYRKFVKFGLPALLCITFILSQSATAFAQLDPADNFEVFNNSPNWVGNVGCNTSSSSSTGSSCGCGTNSGEPTLVGSDPEQQAYNYFVQQGLDNVQAAAVVGNLMDESHLDPTIIQNGGNSNNPAAAGSGGWGIAQWTPGAKIIGIAAGLGVTSPIYDLATQLQIVWLEMTGTSPTGYADLTKGLEAIIGSSPAVLATAVSFFQVNFEGGVAGSRLLDAIEVFQEYGNTTPPSTTGNCTGNCTLGSSMSSGIPPNSPTLSSLSQTRQQVVCIAEQELALWESQPGYPTPPYAASGLLKYTNGWYEEWCADFVSWVYNQAADPLQPDPGWMVPGVSEIETIGQQNKSFQWHPQSSNYTPVPGDMAVHSQSGNPDYHINVFISSNNGVSYYIGGDQGSGPYGANPPTMTPPSPPSGSIVSVEQGSGYYDNNIIGYVSPN